MRSTHLPFLNLSANVSFMSTKYKKRKENKQNNTLSTKPPFIDNNVYSSSRLFNTQIMMSTSYNSANSKRTKHVIQVNKIKILKKKIRDSCNALDKKCIHFNSDINRNPILLESGYINRTANAIKDVTMKSIKDEIANSFHRPLGIKQTNSFTENINSQIRTYLAIAKGTSNFERFRRRIMYCLNDNIFYSTTSFLTSLKRDGKKRANYIKINSNL